MPKPKKKTAPVATGKPASKLMKNREMTVDAKEAKKPTLPDKHRRGTKQDILITMLKRSSGATVEEMSEAVGWQRHSVHGMIHGILRTRLGIQIASQKEQRGRVYRIV